MILFNKFKIVLISSAFLCLCPVLGYADVSCPSGYVKISESDSIIVTNSSSCPSGHTKLSDVSGGTSVTNCTTGLSSGFCTYYSESCQSGKYFDGTTHKTCIAGSYCDGSGTATPGVSGCSKACPENSTSTSGATKCTCNAGYYLNGNECIICPIGSYCANNTKTACDTGYTTDNTGATSESQCYTTCEQQCTQQECPDNATCTHGTTTTTGKQYVGGTCDASASQCELNITCDTGYSKKEGGISVVEKTPLIPVDYHEYGDDYGYISADGDDKYHETGYGLTENNTWASHFDYGTVYGRASCQPSANAGIAYIFNNLETVMLGGMSVDDFESGLSAISGMAKAKYIADVFRGLQDGTKTETDLGNAVFVVFGVEYDANYSTSSTGQYCYCQMTGYAPTDGTKQSVVGASWLFSNGYGSAGNCAEYCASYCADSLQLGDAFGDGFRAAVFSSLGVQSNVMCEIDTIDIPAGYYLPANTTEPVQCPINNYCPGQTGAIFNTTETQGLKPCPDGYSSESGSTSESQCYTTCEQQCTQQECPDNATCAHGATVTTGKQYVGGTCDASASQCEIAVTCNSGYVLSDGKCVQIEFEPEFTITTTKLSADTTFRFTLAAAGTFYINWGDGNIKVIEKTTVAEEIIEHAYADSGTYNIGIAGDAVGYNTGINISSIRFSHDINSDVNGWKYIAGIDGSLGAIFGTLKNPTLTSQTQPRFRYTFSGCTNLTSAIPPELFNGIYGAPVDRMFMGLFNECSKMSGTLPSELFADLSGQITENMFRQSFNSCAGLTGSIPADFFGGLSGELRNSSLYRTFYGCSQLSGYVEPALFANFTESSDAPSQMSGVFTNTGLDTVCPANTYNYDNVFNDYFDGRVSCSPCPNNGLSVSGENSEISACYLDAICSDVGQGTQQCNYNTTTDEYTDCTTCIYTSCNSGYELVDGACEMISFEPEFTITTTEIPANTEFTFNISAAGTYYIDWGDGTIEPIEKTNLTNTPYSHTYELKGTYEIKLAGQAIGYNSDVNTSAIDFSGNTYIAGIDGSLGAIFGTLENPTFNAKTQPRFRYTFSGCTNLTSAIPPELFSGIYGAPTDRMFMAMFSGCSKLSGTLPANLFAGMSGQITENMFRQMFYGCSSLSGPIPSGLFGDLSGQLQTSSFLRTFSGCTSLDGYIPPDLFAKFTRPSTMSGQMTEIFYNTKLDTACPVNMYQYKTGYEEFFDSHVACTPCPDGYVSESGSVNESQCYTTCEQQCTQQTCPDNATCTHGTTTTTGKQYVGGTCDATASQCELTVNCATGYELTNGTCSAIVCESGYYLDDNECIICPIGSYCANNIKTACDTGYNTDNTGASTESQCYTTCEQQCTQQECPDNATCTHGATVTTGKQYVGGTCDATASQCELTVNCATGYELTNGTCSAIVCESGYYLDGNECIICPIGSYCANNIKTACDTGYTTDNTGASTESQCYTTCEVACTQQTCPDNATCTHGTTTTTGKQYIGGTCDATASQCELNIICDKGYDKQSEIELVEQTPLIPVDYTEGGDGYAWSDLSNRWYSSNFKEAGLTKANTWASRFAYGAVYGNASCQPVSVNTESFMYISRNRAAAQNGDLSEEDFEAGLSAISGAEKAGYITKVLRGYKEGTQTQADFYRAIWTMFGTEKNEDFSTTSEGAYCHCQMTDFAPTGQSKQSVTGAWVFSTVYGDDYSCMRLCSQNCSNGLQHDGGLSFDTFRAAIFGFYSIQYETMCIINKVDMPAGYYLPANTTEPVQCPINNYCPGQTGAIFNITETQGLKPCPDGTTSNVGASGIDQCIGGKTLHIGDEIQMNLTTVKPSTPRVMVFDVLGDLYYGGLSETAKPINNNTDKQFRIYDPESNQNYWMHDYTVQ
ncbi:MAG: hypothetical protein R8M71_02000 [Alphaproteobacteria bacterium]|nr:hypothetical protein [Alphaproteobacteria bacterium]